MTSYIKAAALKNGSNYKFLSATFDLSDEGTYEKQLEGCVFTPDSSSIEELEPTKAYLLSSDRYKSLDATLVLNAMLANNGTSIQDKHNFKSKTGSDDLFFFDNNPLNDGVPIKAIGMIGASFGPYSSVLRNRFPIDGKGHVGTLAIKNFVRFFLTIDDKRILLHTANGFNAPFTHDASYFVHGFDPSAGVTFETSDYLKMKSVVDAASFTPHIGVAVEWTVGADTFYTIDVPVYKELPTLYDDSINSTDKPVPVTTVVSKASPGGGTSTDVASAPNAGTGSGEQSQPVTVPSASSGVTLITGIGLQGLRPKAGLTSGRVNPYGPDLLSFQDHEALKQIIASYADKSALNDILAAAVSEQDLGGFQTANDREVVQALKDRIAELDPSQAPSQSK